jgi:hypothetical protein
LGADCLYDPASGAVSRDRGIVSPLRFRSPIAEKIPPLKRRRRDRIADDMSRQQTALAVNCRLYELYEKKQSVSSSSNQASLADYVNRVLKLGLDVHYRQVTVAMQEDGGRIKAAGKMSHEVFLNWV